MKLGICLAFVLLQISAAFAQAGNLDTTFNDAVPSTPAGTVLRTISPGNSGESAQRVAVQRDGKIITGGYTYDGTYHNALARFNADGSPDTTFNGGDASNTSGAVLRDFGADNFIVGLAIQTDGKIVAAIYERSYDSDGTGSYFAAARFNSDGSLDTTFGTNGRARLNINYYDFASDLALQSDGKIIVVGYTYNGSNYRGTAVRFTQNGTLDTTFGGGAGYTVINTTGVYRLPRSVTIQPDNKILVTGGDFPDRPPNTPLGADIFRLTADGQIDTSFGTQDGGFTDPGNATNYRALVLPDGKIVTVGQRNDHFALTRFNSNGTLDTTFGTGGRVETGDELTAAAYDALLQPDGKILAGGFAYRYAHSSKDFALYRYNSNGALDSTFGSGGRVVTDFGSNGDDIINGLAFQPNGRIVAAGSGINNTVSTSSSPALARYFQYSVVNAPADLAVWIPGDGDERDLTGNSAAGTLINGASYAIGEVGQAFNVNGNSQYVSIPDSAAQHPATAVSIEGWFKFNSAPGTTTLVAKPLRGSIYDSYVLYFQSGVLRGGHGNQSSFDSVTSGFSPSVNVWYHIAFTFDGATQTLFVNGTQVAASASTLPLFYDASPYPLLLGGEFENDSPSLFHNGQIDEASLYSRALSQVEIQSIYNAGAGGKLKEVATPSGSNVTTKIATASVTFPTVTMAGATDEIPLDGSNLPPTPTGNVSGVLFFDVSTSAVYSGSPSVCFNVPSFTAAQLASAAVYHLENGVWVNRTGAKTYPSICTSGLTSLSPFAIVPNAPTAASVVISGRVTNGKRGVARARVMMTDATGATRYAMTTAFGYYRFADVPVGETYVFRASAKRIELAPQVVYVTEDVTNLNFASY